MPFITPVGSVFKSRNQFPVFPDDTSATMVEMQVCEEHIGYIIADETMGSQRFIQAVVPVQVIMPEEFFILFIAHAIVDENTPAFVFDE